MHIGSMSVYRGRLTRFVVTQRTRISFLPGMRCMVLLQVIPTPRSEQTDWTFECAIRSSETFFIQLRGERKTKSIPSSHL